MNDYARLLPADAQQRLESRLAERERATGAQMVVAIFPSLEGESLEDFGIRLAERWRPYRTVACWYLWRSIDGAAGKA